MVSSIVFLSLIVMLTQELVKPPILSVESASRTCFFKFTAAEYASGPVPESESSWTSTSTLPAAILLILMDSEGMPDAVDKSCLKSLSNACRDAVPSMPAASKSISSVTVISTGANADTSSSFWLSSSIIFVNAFLSSASLACNSARSFASLSSLVRFASAICCRILR